MAVSVQAPLLSTPGMWHLGDQPNTFPSSGAHATSTSMAYQYPSNNFEPPPNLIPSYHQPPPDQVQPQSIAQGPPTPTSSKNSGTPAAKGAKVKKSMSTPNVRGQAAADAAALALSADKRRNKLGYHRTSVACGHCRRRKIRCIPAPGDAQNRCSNCIRLKKECNFYPVDQQPQPDPRRRSSKSQSGTGRASESTSPTTSTGQLPEIPSNLPSYPPLNMPSIQDLGGPQMKRQRTESFSPENKGVKSLNPGLTSFPDKVAVVTSSRDFNYNNHGPTNWMAPDASPGLKHDAHGDVPQPYWRPNNSQDSPLTPAFSPYTPSLQIPPPQNWPTGHPQPNPRDDLSWSVPQRSISYGNLEALQNQQHQQHQQQQYTPSYTQSPASSIPDHYTTKPRGPQQHPDMYPSLSTQTTGGMMAPATSATTHEPPPHPHSAGSLPSAAYNSWQQPQHYQPKPIGSTGEAYGYANHESLPRPNPVPQYSGDHQQHQQHHPHPPPITQAPTYYQEPQGYYQGPPHPGYHGQPGR